MTPTEMAKALAARRVWTLGTCAVCGRPFVGTTRRRYCGRNCADKAFYAAHKAERNARRRKRREGATDG